MSELPRKEMDDILHQQSKEEKVDNEMLQAARIEELEAENAALKEEVNKKLAGFCMYCGAVFNMADYSDAEVERVYKETLAHDKVCEKNPYMTLKTLAEEMAKSLDILINELENESPAISVTSLLLRAAKEDLSKYRAFAGEGSK